MKAYQAYVTAFQGRPLLGGIMRASSHPFETSAQADAWIHTTIQANAQAGRLASAWGWQEVEHANPIMEHETH